MHKVIPTSAVKRFFSHPGWIPENEEGTVLKGLGTVTVTEDGDGYTSTPKVTVTGGGGSGAVLEAVRGTGGDANKIASIRVVKKGQGYTSVPTVTIVNPTGVTPTTVATATVTIADLEAGDPQNFHNVKGAAVKLGGESGFEEDYEDRTGDGDDGEVNGPTYFRRSFDRTLSWVSPASVNTWMQKFLQTVADDTNRRVATLDEEYDDDGNKNTTKFFVQKLVNVVEEKGVVMGAANLRIERPVEQTRV